MRSRRAFGEVTDPRRQAPQGATFRDRSPRSRGGCQLAAAMPKWCQSWFSTAAYSGLRRSEMVGLRRRDIDLLRRRITVRQQVVEVGSASRASTSPRRPLGNGQSPFLPSWPRSSSSSSPSAPSPERTACLRLHARQHAAPLVFHLAHGGEGLRADRPTRPRLARPPAYLGRHEDRGGRAPEGDPRGGGSLFTQHDHEHLRPSLESRGEKTADAMDEMYRTALAAPAKVTRIGA